MDFRRHEASIVQDQLLAVARAFSGILGNFPFALLLRNAFDLENEAQTCDVKNREQYEYKEHK